MRENEVMCETCQGAGMVPSKGDRMGAVLCPTCNGHGALAVDPHTRRRIAFDVDPVAPQSPEQKVRDWQRRREGEDV